MSEYSVLECDACGATVTEKGFQRVVPHRGGWTQDDEGDLCPECSDQPPASAEAGERSGGEDR